MDSQQQQSQSIRIRLAATKSDLMNRLTDKGHNSIAMPSVKRPLPAGAKPLQAKLKNTSSKATLPAIPPKTSGGHIRAIPQNGGGSEDFRNQFDRPFGASASQKTLGPQRRGLSQQMSEQNLMRSSKMMTSTQEGFTRDQSHKFLNKLDSPLKGQITEAKLYALESIEASHFVPMRETQKKSALTTPQYTDCNMAPYSRPQTQHFGYRLGQQATKDPTGKTPKASEEVISITGLKSMSQLGPAAMPRPKTSQQEVLQKRAKSNKMLKRMIIGGKSEVEEKRKEVAMKLREQESLRALQTHEFDLLPSSAKINPGIDYQDQEYLKSRLLMTKMRGKLEANPFGMNTMTGFNPRDPTQTVPELDEENYDTKDQSQTQSRTLDPAAEMEKVQTEMAKKPQGPGAQQKFNDLDKLITLLQSQPDDDGFYIYLGPQKSGSKDPYDLEPLIKEEEKKEKNPEKFFTLSKKGITTYINDEPVEYITLTDWLIERNFYQRISNLNFFKQFNKWKILRMWRRNILQKKREEVKQNLQEKLFSLDEVFGKILLGTRKNCKIMETSMRLVALPTQGQESLTLKEFTEMQDKQRNDVQRTIEQNSKNNRKEFKDGIDKVLGELRNKINEEDKMEESQKKEYTKAGGELGQQNKEKHAANSDPVFEQLGFKHNLKYGPRSKLRRACSRFLRFAYLLDFIAMDALRNIYIKSVEETLERLGALSKVHPKYELVSQKENLASGKRLEPQKPAPFFAVAAKFMGIERPNVPEEFLIREQIPKFETAFGHTSDKKDFDPTVHLELKEPELEDADEEEAEQQINLEEEVAPLVDRVDVTNLHKYWLAVEPDREQFTGLLNGCFERGLESMKVYERWSRHEELKIYVNVLESWDDKVCEDEWESPEANPKLDCQDWLMDHPAKKEVDEKIVTNVSIAFEKVERFFSELQPFLRAVWQNERLGRLKSDDQMMKYSPPECPFQFLQDPELNGATTIFPLMIERFRDQKNDFEDKISDTRDLGLLKVDFREVKKGMIPSPQTCLQELKKKIPMMVKGRLQTQRDWIEDQIKRLTARVESVDDFVAQVNAIEEISEKIQAVKDDIAEQENIQTIFVLADQEMKDGVPVSTGNEKQKKQAAEELAKKQQELERTLTETKEMSDNQKEIRIKQVKDDTPKIRKWCQEFTKKITQDKFDSIVEDSSEILAELDQLDEECQQLVHRKQKQLDYQRTLEMPQDQLAEIDAAKVATQARVSLWHALDEWGRLTSQWEATIFDAIDAKDITKQAEKYHKTCIRCEKEMPKGSTAVKKLQDMVFQFKEAMPIVAAFKNEKLDKRHWDGIKEILGLERDDPLHEKQFTLGELVKLGVAEHQDDLQMISTTATQEDGIITEIEEINKELSKLEFNFKETNESQNFSEVVLLDKNNEHIQEFLDERLTQVVNLLGNRFITYYQEKASTLSDTLNKISETYDTWREAQRGWCYLDNIFASQEIQKECPGPYTTMGKMNKNLLKYLKKVKLKPQVVSVVSITTSIGDKTLKGFFDDMLAEQDGIQKALDELLQKKRLNFPRFYFVSDEELLKILANSKNLGEIEKSLNKCFDNICRYDYDAVEIKALYSNEGEELRITRGVKAGGKEGPEIWMENMRKEMVKKVFQNIKEAGSDFRRENKDPISKKDWVKGEHLSSPHIGQALCCFSQVLFTEESELYIQEMYANPFSLEDHYNGILAMLQDYCKLIGGKLSDIQRKIIVSLITTDVHNRDIVKDLMDEQVQSINEFDWQKQLRYYMMKEEGVEASVQVRQVVSTIEYGNEYMGATSRLVVTPLTDRCWITITGAMAINLGAAPAGPAGTGKTESTKDLAKALGIYCVVFNCSDQIDYKMMERLFSGVAQTGAWTCLDEFNRIEVEVLSVIAQQLLDIKKAKSAGAETFTFAGVDEMPLESCCGVFITMNPGYAGRAELPDNLKVLFRPVSMMIPSYRLIAEIMLYAEGFDSAPKLSTKMVQLYKLASEQLSQQKHYDFGMRAVKSVLVMAGSLKRANPTDPEDIVLIKAMRNSNVPKFLADDLPLFEALIRDLFPGIEIPEDATGNLEDEIKNQIDLEHMERNETFIQKVIQLFETFNVRFGVMLVGPSGGGKTMCYKILKAAMTQMAEDQQHSREKDERFKETVYKVLNPKSISMGELYGEVDHMTKDWTDGLASSIIREFTLSENRNQFKWTVFDGPVDALWIENMNTVLDDNMTLCLANGERIKLNPSLRMLFEVQDLEVASPATVSRCGMVYMTPSDLGWRPYVKRWVDVYIRKELLPHGAKLYNNTDHGHEETEQLLTEPAIAILLQQFEYCETALERIKEGHWTEPLPTCPVQMVASLCNFLEYFIKNKNSIPCFAWEEKFQDNEDSKEAKEAKDAWIKKLRASFGMAFFWSFGASFHTDFLRQVDTMCRDFFGFLKVDGSGYVLDYFLDEREIKFKPWSNKVKDFKYDPSAPFFSLLVPTVDTTRYSAILDMLVTVKKHIFFTGNTGVGKSVIIQKYLAQNQERQDLAVINLSFSAQTTSKMTQETIESKLGTKAGKEKIGPSGKKTAVIFVDDINMPLVEEYGAQPPIEILRQMLDMGGIYNRSPHFWKDIDRFILLAAAAPPTGGRYPLTPRIMRHFQIFNLPDPDEIAMQQIFNGILDGFLTLTPGFIDKVKGSSKMAVAATIDMYSQIKENKGLKPIPTKFHYTFNLRDVAKVFQGILMVQPGSCQTVEQFAKLWLHECQRVFYDRLVSVEDREIFIELAKDFLVSKFGLKQEQLDIFGNNSVIFSKILKLDLDDQLYEQVEDREKLLKVLNEKLEDYNTFGSGNRMDLVFFEDAIFHLCRILRILSQPRGNAMLIGVSGCGKQSLTRLSSQMLEYDFQMVTITKSYGAKEFRDDMRNKMKGSIFREDDEGKVVPGLPTTFLMTDTQITQDTFLEDLNNVLNTGEITNLYSKDDKQQMRDWLSEEMQKKGLAITPDTVYAEYIAQVRDRFHIIMCMSPVGNLLRIRCRMFPSLVNCCTLDWFDNWPEEALLSVSSKLLKDTHQVEERYKKDLSELFASVHKDIEQQCKDFYIELRRQVYVTPKSYLDGINLYLSTLTQKTNAMTENISRLSKGIETLKATKSQIAGLQVKLTEMEPAIVEAEAKGKAQAEQVDKQTEEVVIEEIQLGKEKDIVQRKAAEVSKVKDEADAEVAKAMPILERAKEAVDKLDSNDINTIKSYADPPKAIKHVVNCVMVYLGYKDPDWKKCKEVMQDQLKNKLKNYPKENVNAALRRKVVKYLTDKEYTMEKVQQSASAGAGIFAWCNAMHDFSIAQEKVDPLVAKANEAQRQQQEAQAEVDKKEAQYAKLIAMLDELKRAAAETAAKLQELQEQKERCKRQLKNAASLLDLLGGEGERWELGIKQLEKEREQLVGDIFIAAAQISYVGPFTGSYRDRIEEMWQKRCSDKKIPITPGADLVRTVGDPVEIQSWAVAGLPSDAVSIKNGILATRNSRWPLLIDPQTQGNSWIKKLNQGNDNFTSAKLSGGGTQVTARMERALADGSTILLEDCPENIDPGLDPVLTKATFNTGEDKLLWIRYNERKIMYDDNFRLFLTTKDANPHYLPETCIKLTIINFTVTFEGLEQQMLVDVVNNERPDIEETRVKLVMEIAADKRTLKMLQDKILKDLSDSDSSTILDNTELINTLEESGKSSIDIGQKLEKAEIVQVTINETRNKYKDVSTRGSILYFVIVDLSGIDPMYQNSLRYVKDLFNMAMKNAKDSIEEEIRIQNLIDNITMVLYNNICRGLFESHKLLYSFLICTSIMRNAGSIPQDCWKFLLRGAGLFDKSNMPEHPEGSEDFLTALSWDLAYCLERSGKPQFENLTKKISGNLEAFRQFALDESQKSYFQGLPLDLGEMDNFSKLLMLKLFKPQKIIYAAQEFVKEELGAVYAEAPVAKMDSLFADSTCKTPIIFVLSQGADPTDQLLDFAEQQNFSDKFVLKSLGQGQGESAEAMINEGKREGKWILLQNCHLFKTWMGKLAELCEQFEEDDKIDSNFRLILTSMPEPYFPASVLQNGLKMTTEPPKGLKANLMRTYNTLINEDTYEALRRKPEDKTKRAVEDDAGSEENEEGAPEGAPPAKPRAPEKPAVEANENERGEPPAFDNTESWRKLLFGLAFFHAVIQERRKYGPLGWNIKYEFNDSDLKTSISMLEVFLRENEDIPWESLHYMTGQINYGGRVTDDWDRVLLLSLLSKTFSADVVYDEDVEGGYKFSPSGIYYVPKHETIHEIRDYISQLPWTQEPEVFGMHANASIAFQKNESDTMVNTILDVQPRESGGGGGRSADEIVIELAEQLELDVPALLEREEAAKGLFALNSQGLMQCLSTVLVQEMERFNRLLKKITLSLGLLQKAIQGLVELSEELDLMNTSLQNNRVPKNWEKVAYLSLKPLASWFEDLKERVQFMRNWLQHGHPPSFWLSGFFFPHGFMTGTLQTYARNYEKPIDRLKFTFKVLHTADHTEITKGPKNGIYVYGLFLEAARWNKEEGALDDQFPGQMVVQFPLIHFLPTMTDEEAPKKQAVGPDEPLEVYECPCYKTSERAGILTTTGQSSNFILPIDIPSNEASEYWTQKGTALLTMLNE